MTYFTLCTRNAAGVWSPQFGDYSRAVVRDEAREYRREYASRDLYVVATEDEQYAINAAVVRLNTTNDYLQNSGVKPTGDNAVNDLA